VAIRWTRPALDARLAALEQQHHGRELIDAVVSFAETLTDEDKRLLQDVLLERAGRDRVDPDAPHWTDDARFFRRVTRRWPRR
jgi:hypothetical protein